MCRVIRTKLPKSQDLVNEKDADRIQLLIGSGCWWCDHRKATDGGWWHAEIAHLKASPYPEATDPFCRLPLSTLFYRHSAEPWVPFGQPADYQPLSLIELGLDYGCWSIGDNLSKILDELDTRARRFDSHHSAFRCLFRKRFSVSLVYQTRKPAAGLLY